MTVSRSVASAARGGRASCKASAGRCRCSPSTSKHAGVLATDGTIGTYFNTKAEVYSVMTRASWLFNWGGPVVARY